MKLSKNTWIVIGVIGVVILIYWIMTKNKKSNSESSFDKSKQKKNTNELNRLEFSSTTNFGFCGANEKCCVCTSTYGGDCVYENCSAAPSCCKELGYGNLVFSRNKNSVK